MLLTPLRSSYDFNYLSKHGYRYYGRYFSLIVLSSSEQLSVFKNSRYSFLAYGLKIGRKFSKKAVTRNLVKRRIKHALREISKELELRNILSCSVIIIPRSYLHDADFARIKKDLHTILMTKALPPGPLAPPTSLQPKTLEIE